MKGGRIYNGQNSRPNCDICSKILPSKEALKDHIDFKHKGKIKHRCQECDKVYENVYLLRKHKICHEVKKFKCYSCPKAFSYVNELNRHTRIIHENAPKVTCDICEKNVRDIAILKRHITIIHGKFKVNKCGVCDEELEDDKSLNDHINQSHNDLRHQMHDCNYCDNSFLTNFKLRKHKSLHMIRVPTFQCNKCDMKFSFQVHLKSF